MLETIGANKHIQGDSTNSKTYKEIMGNEKANLILADPPYCLLERKNKKGELRDSKRSKIHHTSVSRYNSSKEFFEFSKSWMLAAKDYVDDNGVWCIWTNLPGIEPIKMAAKEIGLKNFVGEFKWGKRTKSENRNDNLIRIYEVALIFTRDKISQNIFLDPAYSGSVITSYDEEGEGDKYENHPNHKPFSCISPVIKNFSNENDLILDPFTGSGSTPSAAISMNRVVFGIEILDQWTRVTRARMRDLCGDKMALD